MANIVPYSFPVELLKGNHDFVNDTYTISLYTTPVSYTHLTLPTNREV